MSAPRIAIIGGGWAGLAAAVTAVKSDVRVCVFEASRSWGGRARTVELEGKHLDNGQHIMLGAYRETLTLMRTVGVDPDRALLRKRLSLHAQDGFCLRRAPLPSPWHIGFGLIAACGLSWREKVVALRFAHWCRSRRYQLPADESLISLLRRKNQSAKICRVLWEPLCVSALNTPIEHASAQIFLNVLRDSVGANAQDSDLLLPRTSLGAVFPQPAADYLSTCGQDLRLGQAVRIIQAKAQGFDVDGEYFDAVILAVAPQHAVDLLPHAQELENVRGLITAFSYEPIFTCYLQYASGSLSIPMLGFNEGLVQWAFDRGRLDGHTGLIAAVISARGAHQRLDRDDLILRVDEQLRAVLRKPGALIWSRVIAEKLATYSCRPGLVRPANATALRGFYLAGDYTKGEYPATIEAAVRSGVRAAEFAIGDLRNRPPH
ncbi:MAG TPA: hydroxysqualene dehydroxylase HpnE [Burkholderiales bacterium]|nr:hydroxysqualene dehydroxylase HpnE [Burkholderiales bacterium]